MKKIVLLSVCLLSGMALFAQNFKALGDAKAAEGDYSGAATYYEMGMDEDESCALSLFILIYEKKVEAQFSDQLYEIILPLAQKGRAEAQFYLASMYDQGYGIEKDPNKAMEWHTQAADQGYEESIKYVDKIKEEERLAAELKAKEEEEQQMAAQKAKEEEDQRIAAQKAKEEEEQRLATQTVKEEKKTPPVTNTKSGIKFSFGVKAGVNLSNINGADFTTSMQTGFHLGALCSLRFGYRTPGAPGMVALQPELLYSQQGFKVTKEACNLSYITLPILLKVYLFNGLHINAGPYFSYLLGVSPESININGPKVMLSDLKGGADVGVCIGAGYDTQMGLTLGARFALGLSDLAGNFAGKNSVISVSVGWNF